MTDHATPHAPADPFAEVSAETPAETPEEHEARLARRRARRGAAARWATATLVFALAGTGAALAVTAPERTDLPGLATPGDGRYTFPPLTLPPLPSGSSAPDRTGRNVLHTADLRYLLLPAPKEASGTLTPALYPIPTAAATASPSASATPAPSPTASPSASASPSTAPSGQAPAEWVTCDAILAEQQDPAKLRELLLRDACRAATVREWTASDGTRTQIRLLRFGASFESWDVFSALRSDARSKALPGAKTTSHGVWDTVEGVHLDAQESSATGAKGTPTARIAYLGASDLVAVITMTNPDGVPAAAFRQVVTLQSDLLA
ncbi:hypothetical protein P3T27_002433 [Kitasatospora sp. MAA19]|uniref:hypothetical protein n=1 Tax=Kitasatospora sp. MAA19 TaxID=3035090 RepID=UPI0024753EA0|nr:hypothetical protein [Kitasatospora sp. MAA19]MDH6705711.1 hypothetical protein [Kitasatospora sp. MAA19]